MASTFRPPIPKPRPAGRLPPKRPTPVIDAFGRLAPMGNTLAYAGLGLMQGKNWQEGLQMGLAGALEGSQTDKGRYEKLKAEKKQNESEAYLQNNFPELYEKYKAGAPMEAVWSAALKGDAEGFTLQAGQTRYDADGNVLATGGTVLPDLGDQYAIESGMARDYGNTSAVKAYEEVRNGYEKVQQAAAQGSGAGDMSMIFGFMKMLDPGSTVREGEYATAQNTGGIPAAVVNLYNKALDGQFLTEAQRNDFLNTADGLYQETVGNLEPVNQQFSTRAGEYGVDPSRFLRVPETYQKPGGGISGKTSTGITFDFTPG